MALPVQMDSQDLLGQSVRRVHRDRRDNPGSLVCRGPKEHLALTDFRDLEVRLVLREPLESGGLQASQGQKVQLDRGARLDPLGHEVQMAAKVKPEVQVQRGLKVHSGSVVSKDQKAQKECPVSKDLSVAKVPMACADPMVQQVLLVLPDQWVISVHEALEVKKAQMGS
jgi:hypothetical protein